jgi:hypothetical protein
MGVPVLAPDINASMWDFALKMLKIQPTNKKLPASVLAGRDQKRQ